MPAPEQQFRIRATKNPITIGMPSRRPKEWPKEAPTPCLELAGSGIRPHPKLPGRKDFELITSAERDEIVKRPEVADALAKGRLVIEAA